MDPVRNLNDSICEAYLGSKLQNRARDDEPELNLRKRCCNDYWFVRASLARPDVVPFLVVSVALLIW